jgi:sulfoacetaldehyde dehydrogenase
MRQADLVVATGSQNNVRAAYESGTPAVGVGAGNVSVIVDETADVPAAAAKIARSKTFDHATSCSSENSVIAVAAVHDALLAALVRGGRRAARCGGGPATGSGDVRRRQARAGVHRQGRQRDRRARGARPPGAACGEVPDRPRGRRRSRTPVLRREALAGAGALSRRSFTAAATLAERLLRYQGQGTRSAFTRARRTARSSLDSRLPVCRVIVNQAHCFATGGSFDNALPFSLSMGCGTWGGNSISDNLNYRHFLNITRVVHPLPPDAVREPAPRNSSRTTAGSTGCSGCNDADPARGHRRARGRRNPTRRSCSRRSPTPG